MAKSSRAKLADRKPWPESVKFFVIRPMERSGLAFLPQNHHLRLNDQLPAELPAFGAKTNGKTIPLHPDSTITIHVVEHYRTEVVDHYDLRGAVEQVTHEIAGPFEWTPADIYAAMKSGTIAPDNPRDLGVRELVAEGVRRSQGASTVKLIPQLQKVYRKYETAGEVPMTAEGYSKQGRVGEIMPFA